LDDKNSFYRAIGFAYLENLFRENLNLKSEKLILNQRISQLIIQLANAEFNLISFTDFKKKKQEILGFFSFYLFLN
jgi:hypothetical protein